MMTNTKVGWWRHLLPSVYTDSPEMIAEHLRLTGEQEGPPRHYWDYLTLRRIESSRYDTYIPLGTGVRVGHGLGEIAYRVSATWGDHEASTDVMRAWSNAPEKVAARGLAQMLMSGVAPSVSGSRTRDQIWVPSATADDMR